MSLDCRKFPGTLYHLVRLLLCIIAYTADLILVVSYTRDSGFKL